MFVFSSHLCGPAMIFTSEDVFVELMQMFSSDVIG